MKQKPPSLFVALTALCLFCPRLGAEDAPPPDKVTKLDGSTLFGVVELTDDYTVRIKSDSGIQNLPLAILSEKDFQKFSANRDRSQDGRLWSERKAALEEEQNANPGENPALEIQLSKIAPLAPLIEAYESSALAQAAKAPSSPESRDSPKSSEGSSTTLHMFSGPGSLNVPSSIPGPALPSPTGASETILAPAAAAGEVLPGGLTPP